MSRYAFVKNGKVTNTIVGESFSAEFIDTLKSEHEIDDVISLEDDTIAIGDDYDGTEFRPVSPFSSWVWDAVSRSWQAPIPVPKDGKIYSWNEEITNWEVVDLP